LSKYLTGCPTKQDILGIVISVKQISYNISSDIWCLTIEQIMDKTF